MKDLKAMGLGPDAALANDDSEAGGNGAGSSGSDISGGRYFDGASRLGARLLLRDMHQWSMAAAQIGDGGAVAFLLLPECVATKQLSVSVELRGEHTRGMTVCDLRPCVFAPDKPRGALNAAVCVDADGPALMRLYVERVLRPPPHCPFFGSEHASPIKAAAVGAWAAGKETEAPNAAAVARGAAPGTAASPSSLRPTRAATVAEALAVAVASAPLTACFVVGALGVVLGRIHARRPQLGS